MQIAAAIADFFHLDPLAVLNSNYFDWCVRLAAYDKAVEAKIKAHEEQERRMKQQR